MALIIHNFDALENYESLKHIMKPGRIINNFLLVLVACLCVYVYLVLFPQVLFKEKVSYRNFNIYSNEHIDNKIFEIIDNAIVELRKSELYDSTKKQKIFFIHDSFYNRLTGDYNRNQLGYHEFFINNTMIVPKVDVKENTLIGIDGRLHVLAATIVHETIHSFQENRYGFFKVLRTPEWKLEGYAFYIARSSKVMNNGHLSVEYARQCLNDVSKYQTRKGYWLYGFMTGYLLTEKGITLDELMNDSVKYQATLDELIKWYWQNRGMYQLFASI